MKWIAVYIILLLPFCGYGQVYYTDLDNAAAALKQNDFYKYHYWIQEADKDYRKNPNWCGNGQEAYYDYVTLLDAVLKDKISNVDGAIETLMPLAVNRGLMGENIYIIDTLKKIARHKYSNEQVKDEIKKAVDNIRPSLVLEESKLMINIFGKDYQLNALYGEEYYFLKDKIDGYAFQDLLPHNLIVLLLTMPIPAYQQQALVIEYMKSTRFYKTMMAD